MGIVGNAQIGVQTQIYTVTMNNLLNIPKQFPDQLNGNNNTHLIGL